MLYVATPATQTVASGVNALITVTLTPPLGSLQVFGFSDGGRGGIFAGNFDGFTSSSVFSYSNVTPGIYLITITPGSGPLAGQPSQAVQVIVTAGSPPAPTGFSLTPASNSAPINTPTAAYIIELLDSGLPAVAGVGGQAFTLSSSDTMGLFSPGAIVTVPAGQSSVSFVYQSPNTGVAILTSTAVGSPYAINTATAQAVITLPGAGIGGRMSAALIKANGMEFGEAYLLGTLTNPDDTPFAKLQSLDIKIATALKEAMGPEQYLPVGAGISDRKYTADLTVVTYSLQRLQLLLGGSAAATLAAIADATTAPTLTAASGTTAFTAGFVGVAYAYRSKWGTGKVSAVATVSVTSGQQIGVTSLGALPAGVLSVDWYVTTQSYTTAPLAAAAALQKLTNNAGTAFNITLYGSSGILIPTASQINTAGNVYTSYGYDTPVPFTIHCVNPADGSGRNLLIYGCVCTDISNAMKLRDWTSEKITANIYGDNTFNPAKVFEWAAPAGYLV